MLKKLIPLLVLFFSCCFSVFSQEVPIEIEEERVRNRLFLHAINKNLIDLDVAITVEGTGIRQRKGPARKVRVPATSKVNLISLIIERGKEPQYTYTLDVSDSLSRRVIKREYEKIKIDPKKSITLYLPENCRNCDSIINPLNESPYNYKSYNIWEDEKVQSQLNTILKGSKKPLEEVDTAIIAIDGKMLLYILTYEDMMVKVNEEDEEETPEEDNEEMEKQ